MFEVSLARKGRDLNAHNFIRGQFHAHEAGENGQSLQPPDSVVAGVEGAEVEALPELVVVAKVLDLVQADIEPLELLIDKRIVKPL